jgi:aminoglycoside 2'-N-acetyltransferase I
MDVRIEVVREAELPQAVAEAIGYWAVKAFEDHGGYENCLWAPADWRILVYAGGQLVSFLKVTEREVSVGEERVRVAGLGDVVTLPEWRGRGLAGLALRRLNDEMSARAEVEFGMLMCLPELVPYYSRFGWQTVPEPIVYTQSWGKETSTEVTMVLPLRDRAWPGGPIDINGLPW